VLIGSREGVAITIKLILVGVGIDGGVKSEARARLGGYGRRPRDRQCVRNLSMRRSLAMESEGQKDAQPKEEEKTHTPRADTPCITVAFYHFLPSLKPVSRPTIGGGLAVDPGKCCL
jgi:hypothetical protein